MINIGINGFSTLQSMLLLKKYRQQLSPDLVVLQLFNNDFKENLENRGAYPKPYRDWRNNFVIKNHPIKHDISLGKRFTLFIGNHTWFYRRVLLAAYLKWGNLDRHSNKYSHPQPPTKDDMLTAMNITLGELADYCRGHNISLLVMHHDLEEPQKSFIQAAGDSLGIRFEDLDHKVFQGQQDYTLGDFAGHWNDKGHSLVAAYIGPEIRRILEKRNPAEKAKNP
jgi:hypothetical protein